MHEFEPNPLFEHFLSKSGFTLAFKALRKIGFVSIVGVERNKKGL